MTRKPKNPADDYTIDDIEFFLDSLKGELLAGDHIKARDKLLDWFPIEKEVCLAHEVRDYISVTSGYFSVTDIYDALLSVTKPELKKEEKRAIRQAVHKLKKSGYIEPHPKDDRKYRRVEREMIKVDWKSAEVKELPFQFGLGIDKHFVVYKKNIVVVCSHPDGGKSAYLLTWLKNNQKKIREVYGQPALYLVNDMGSEEFKKRVSLHEDMKEDDWDLEEVYERYDRFEDVVLPDGVTIIDFIQEENPYEIGQTFKRIHQKLNTGIVMVALQKPFDRDLGYGKEYSMQYPRLYMIFDTKRDDTGLYGMAKVLKCKNRKDGGESLTGKSKRFKLISGWQFRPEGIWHYEGDDPYEKELKKIGGKK